MNDYIVEIWYVYFHCNSCSGHRSRETFCEVARTPKSALKKAIKDWGKRDTENWTPVKGVVWHLDNNVYEEILHD